MKKLKVLVCVCLMAIPASVLTSDTDCGVEWICTYPVCGFDTVWNRDDCAIGFYNTMLAHGYTGRFNWGQTAAWADDFMDAELVPSGNDHNWVDKVDICYHSDHGNAGHFGFGVAHDRCIVSAANCRWGDDYDLEWIVLDDCSCLRHGHYGVWWPAFDNLHMILSFDTGAHDSGTRGRLFAEKLAAGWSVRQAWWYACEQTEGDDTYAAIAGACDGDRSIYDECVWKFGWVAPDPVPLAWWWWTHHKC